MQSRARDLGTAGLDQSCVRHTKSFVLRVRGVTALLARCTSWSPGMYVYPNERTDRLSLGAAGPHSYTMSDTTEQGQDGRGSSIVTPRYTSHASVSQGFSSSG